MAKSFHTSSTFSRSFSLMMLVGKSKSVYTSLIIF